MNGTTTVNNNGKTDAEVLVEAAKKFGSAELIKLGDYLVLSVPNSSGGREIKSVKKFIDEYQTAPDRKSGTAKITSLDSFIAHVNRHKDGDSVLFADENQSSPALLAVYDYNRKGTDGAPRFGQHRANYSFPVSDEWKAWVGIAGRELTQEAFAELLEDRIGDVMVPAEGGDTIKEFAVNLGIDLATPQHLMSLSRGLKIHVNQEVGEVRNLTTGEAQIVFTEEHKSADGGTVRVPGGFALAIPVFRLGTPWQVPVRLRYRKNGARITWTVTPHRTDIVFKTAFEEAVKKAADDTALPVFYGAPES